MFLTLNYSQLSTKDKVVANLAHSGVEFSFLYCRFLAFGPRKSVRLESCLQTLKPWFWESKETLQIFILNSTSHDRRQRRENPIRIFLLVKKNHVRLLIGQKKIVWPMRLLVIKERLFLFGEFVRSKSRCAISWEWLTFWVFYELQGKDSQQKVFLGWPKIWTI